MQVLSPYVNQAGYSQAEALELMNYLTAIQAAERLGVSPNRVRVLIREKRLPATLFGTNYMIKESDLTLVKHRKVGRPPLKKRKAA